MILYIVSYYIVVTYFHKKATGKYLPEGASYPAVWQERSVLCVCVCVCVCVVCVCCVCVLCVCVCLLEPNTIFVNECKPAKSVFIHPPTPHVLPRLRPDSLSRSVDVCVCGCSVWPGPG
jgi:hypothetical protein